MTPNAPSETDPLAPIEFDAHKLPPDIVRGVRKFNALAALLLEVEFTTRLTPAFALVDEARVRLRALREGG